MTTHSRPRLRSPLAAVALLVALSVAGPTSAAEERAPVPEKDARAPALASCNKEFRTELKSKDPEVKKSLATTLLDRAAGDEDLARRYVYIEQAAKLAQGAKDIRLALAAINLLEAKYEVDGTPLAFKAVNDIARGSKDVAVLADAATALIDLSGQAVAKNDAATAGKAISAAKSHAKKAKMGGIGARAGAVGKLVNSFKQMRAGYAALEKSVAEGLGTDPVVCAGLTRFTAFAVGDFDGARGFVQHAADAPYNELLVHEGQLEDAPEGRPGIADGWWALAQTEKAPLVRARMLARAAFHYAIVLDQEHEHDAARIRKRIDSITYSAWDGGIALTTDFSKFGPANVAIATIRGFIAKEKIDTKRSGWRSKLPRFPDITYAPGVDYFWKLETNQGDITIRLFADTAPQHVTNFIYLTELGFFDGLTFHRVITGFMAQGGDPTGSGSGGPGYFIKGEYGGDPKHDEPGILSMANTGQPKTDGSQFFITFRPCPELNGKYTVFGKVTDGMKTVKKLEAGGSSGGTPKSRLVIDRATIVMR